MTASLAVVGWLVAVGCGVGAIVIRVVDPAPIAPNAFNLGDAGIVAFVLQALAFASVGALLVHRRPNNAVGKVLVLAGAGYAVSMLAAVLTFNAVAEAPGGEAASRTAWLGVVSSFVGAASLPYLAFIFPTGRAQNARWDRIRLLQVALLAAVGVTLATQPGPIQLLPGIENPLGIGPDLRQLFGERVVLLVTGVGGLAVGGMAVLAVVFRYRAAEHVERQQLKWFSSAAVATLGSFAVTSSSVLQSAGPAGELPAVVYGLTGALVPIAIGVAILRHRLYDIDRLIGRTLAYGSVSAVLASVYVVTVLAVGGLLGSFRQGGSVAVAAATLAVYVLFGPVRSRAQRIVDRHFDRSRFDAAKTLAAVAERLRNELEADRIEAEIVAVVATTLRPARTQLWRRPPVRAGPRNVKV